MKKLFLIFLLSTLIVNAQDPAFLWVKSTSGNNGSSNGVANAVDADGNIYTLGNFNGMVSYTTDLGTLIMSSAGGQDIFIFKHDPDGNLIWIKTVGGTGNENGNSITADAIGNIYLTGNYSSGADFDPGPGIFNLPSSINKDIFILKLDAGGNFIWAKSFEGLTLGNYPNSASSIILDALGNILTTGRFIGVVDFDPGPAANSINETEFTIFISKLDANGNFVSITTFDGNGNTWATDIALDVFGNIFLSGSFADTMNFDPGINTYTISEKSAGFVLKLNSNCNFIWAKTMPVISMFGYIGPRSIAVDALQNVYLTGAINGTINFNTGPGIYTLASSGIGSDIFIMKLNTNGDLSWAQNMGGGGYMEISPSDISYSRGNSICVDAASNVLLTGVYSGSVDFNVAAPTQTMGYGGIFILKLNSAGNYLWAGSMSHHQYTEGASIVLDTQENIISTGWYSGNVAQDFDPGPGTSTLICNWSNNVYVHKMSACCVGVEEVSIEKEEVNIYPNPTNGILNVESENLFGENTSVEITNALGEIILQEKIITQNSTFNIQHFTPGIYFVNVTSDNRKRTFKLVKDF